jgi:hypothetical protein
VVGQFSLSRPVGRLFALSQFGLSSFLSKGCASQEWEISLWKAVEKELWLGWVGSRHNGRWYRQSNLVARKICGTDA